MSTITATFRELKRRNEGGLIAYAMAGDPSAKHTVKIADALIAGGADILELGIPFSDPISDGPTLQRAAARALKARTTPRKVFDTVAAIRTAHEVPIVLMTYYNIVHQMGAPAFCRAAEKSGVNGIVAPDLPVEEAGPYKKAAAHCGLDTIFLAAESTSDARLKDLLEASSGFLYLVSTNGVTGTRETLRDDSKAFIKRAASLTGGRVPLGVGFGLSQPSHVRQVIASGASAAIIGSRFAKIVEQNLNSSDVMWEKLRRCAQTLKGGAALSSPRHLRPDVPT